MTDPIQALNGDLIRRRRAELGLSSRATAKHLGVTGTVVTRLEAGDNHLDVTIGLVVRLAELLGVEVRDLIAEPPDDAGGTPASDVAAVGALLCEANVETPSSVLRAALGWDSKRLRLALDQLDRNLRSVGMRLARNDIRYRIVRDVNAVDTSDLATLIRKLVIRNGLNRTEASMLHRIGVGDAPREPNNPQSVAIGTLVNAELVVFDEQRSGAKERPLILSDEVRFSLLLAEG